MKTLFLYFADKAEADAVLAPFLEQGLCVDFVGQLHGQAGAAPEPLSGWHVNVLAAELPEPLLAYEVFPETPARVFAVEPKVTNVPASVTRRQARQALLQAGLLARVQPAIDAIGDPVARQLAQIEWDDSQDFERHRPLLIQLGQAIGLDAAAMDALFIQAGGL